MLLNLLTDRQTNRRRDRRETDLPKKRKEKMQMKKTTYYILYWRNMICQFLDATSRQQ